MFSRGTVRPIWFGAGADVASAPSTSAAVDACITRDRSRRAGLSSGERRSGDGCHLRVRRRFGVRLTLLEPGSSAGGRHDHDPGHYHPGQGDDHHDHHDPDQGSSLDHSRRGITDRTVVRSRAADPGQELVNWLPTTGVAREPRGFANWRRAIGGRACPVPLRDSPTSVMEQTAPSTTWPCPGPARCACPPASTSRTSTAALFVDRARRWFGSRWVPTRRSFDQSGANGRPGLLDGRTRQCVAAPPVSCARDLLLGGTVASQRISVRSLEVLYRCQVRRGG